MNLPLIAHAFLLFTGAFLATFYLIPKVIDIVVYKRLMDNPNERSSHIKATPSLGGLAFYIVFILSLYFNDGFDTYHVSMSIIPGLTILLFLGLKDDLVVLAPSTKLIGQVAACVFVLLNYKFEVENFHGFLGIYNMPFWLGASIALVFMLTVVNAFNLIDGIDGLAASVGIVSFASFGFLFFLLERDFLAMSALTMCAILCAFLFFNLSKRDKRKIFMGDTGSMLIGFLIAVMAVRMLALEDEVLNKLPFNKVNIPIILMAMMIIPLYDTVRVFTIRILQGKSPFSADRNHLHHVLIDSFGISHRRASFYIAAIQGYMVVGMYILVKATNIWISAITILALGFLATYLLNRWTQKRNQVGLRKRTKQSKQLKEVLGQRPKLIMEADDHKNRLEM